MTGKEGLIAALIDLTNSLVEIYLANVIKPFLVLHEKFYKALNASLRALLDENAQSIPVWFTANFITYVRTAFVIPCVLLIANGYTVLPALIILGADFGDFLDGVVARFWVDRKEIEAVGAKVEDASSKDKPELKESWSVAHRSKSYGGFIDAVCDKAFVVPCWIAFMASIPDSTHLKILQYIVLWSLILTEITSGSIRFRAYFSTNGVPAPSVKGLDFSTSAVKADHIGKAKQTFEMFGSAFFILAPFRYLGLLLLTAAVPLAYESVRRKVKSRVIYVSGDVKELDHNVLKFWKQAKGLGSKLIVGISSDDKDAVANASACESVDCVIANAPVEISKAFLDKMGVDYILSSSTVAKISISQDLASHNCCLEMVDESTCTLVGSGKTEKSD